MDYGRLTKYAWAVPVDYKRYGFNCSNMILGQKIIYQRRVRRRQIVIYLSLPSTG